MQSLLHWFPLLWAVRLLLLVYAAGLAYVSALYLARFLRPANARALASGGLPRIGRVEGGAKVLGQEVTIAADVQDNTGERLSALEARVAEIDRYLSETDESVADLLARNSVRKEAP